MPAPSSPPEDLHEWVSFEDPDEDRTWIFDLTFLQSNWSCLYGRGCPGVLSAPAAELEQGCCSYGAHFTGKADRANVEEKAAQLDKDEWQYARKAKKRGGPIFVNKDGETVSRVVDGACIFLNRPDFAGGAGCALHSAALRRGESITDWKPEVCWQVPLRCADETDVYGHVTSTIREWKRRDWGPGGQEFEWWCTSDTELADAFIGDHPVWVSCREELVAMTSPAAYALLEEYLGERAGWVPLPHPALRAGRQKSPSR
jgi:hypothetical protein